MEQFTLELETSEFISEHTKHFVFKRTDNNILNFIPGQFISLLIKKGEKFLKRNYSVANPPGGSAIEFSCSYIKGGLASEILFNMQKGDEILAAGPFGLLVLPKEIHYPRYFFFATGTGVTPCRSMLPEIASRVLPTGSEFHLIFGARTKQDFIYKEEFVAFAKQNPNFKLHVCYSKLDNHKDVLDFEYSGRVQTRIKDLAITNSDLSYLCGNPNMVDDVFSALLELGVERRNIKREKYISAKH